ncbi:hypothetical protein BU15DRAFT_67027 [Melanogaster broomeanus]|nr:hypothetical protein BU15DRAFT_67027 [Melanogaster broomeanus]
MHTINSLICGHPLRFWEASSIPCECIFSSSAKTNTKKHNHISPTLMEALQMLKYNFKKRRLDFTSRQLQGVFPGVSEVIPLPIPSKYPYPHAGYGYMLWVWKRGPWVQLMNKYYATITNISQFVVDMMYCMSRMSLKAQDTALDREEALHLLKSALPQDVVVHAMDSLF